MHNLQTRANNILSFSLSVLACVLAVVAAMSMVTGYGTATGTIKVDTNTLRVVTRRYGPDHFDYGGTKNEFARLSFDIDADFSPVFNWNTKQVFVSVVAEYETKTHNRNSIVLWDRIITQADTKHLILRNVPIKYALIDVSRRWSHQQANLSIHWDITPHVGVLQSGRSPSSLANIVLAPAETK